MHITKVEFRNCQSLRDISYEFASGLNVIVAPDNDGNSTGKSVFFKCLRTAVGADFFEKDEIIHLITYGEKAASALFTLSDGSAGGFVATERKIIYLWRDVGINSFEKLTAPHPEFLRKMSVVMDEKTKFVLNILDSDELLFINSREDTNYSILRLISDNETLEELIPAIEEKIDDYTKYRTRAEQTNMELHRKLNSLEKHNLPAIEQAVSCGELLLPVLNSLVQIEEILQQFKSRAKKDLYKTERLLKIYQILVLIDSQFRYIKTVKEIKYESYGQLLEKYQGLIEIKENLKEVRPIRERDTGELKSSIDLYKKIEIIRQSILSIEHLKEFRTDSYSKLLIIYQNLENLSKYIEIVTPVPQSKYTFLNQILALYQSIGGISDMARQIKLKKYAAAIQQLQIELKAWAGQIVCCPVKGYVYFFSEGCVECDKSCQS